MRSPPNRSRWPEAAYWLLPLLLTAVEALWVARSTELLRFEDVSEGIRNSYWLGRHALYDGISTNVGWYGLLLAVYRLFGFSLFAAKWVKLALYAGAVLCLAFVLRRPWGGAAPMGPWRAAVPLLAIGLSPSLLYFGTVATSFGTDLLYLPYLLALVAWLAHHPSSGWRDGAARLAFGAIAMLAWTSYPVFAFYLPALALVYLSIPQDRGAAAPAAGLRRRFAGHLPGLSLRAVGLALAGFLLPLAAAAAWLEHPVRLFHDPATGSGLFRGGGTGFDLDPAAIARHVAVALHDLFVRGTSYYFWLERPDLAGPVGITAFLAVGLGSVQLVRRRSELRPWIALAWLLPAINLLVVSAGEGPQGLRRSTSLLAGFYLLYTLVWRWLIEERPAAVGRATRPARLRRIAAVILLLLPVHHLVSTAAQYPRLPRAGEEQTHLWLRVRPTAEESFRYWLERTAAGEPLDCRELGLEPERCQYGGIYALLSGYRRWNGMPEVPLRGYDYRAGRHVELSTARLSGEFSRRGERR